MHQPGARQIFLSLAVAFMCYLLPWAGFGLLLRPDFVLLVLIYWLLRAPHLCNIGIAWLLGLLVDLATGSLFGQNAMAYTITASVAVFYQRRLALFSEWQQAGYVLLLLLLNQFTLLILKLFSGSDIPPLSYFLSSLTGVLLWQAVVFSRIRGTGLGDQP